MPRVHALVLLALFLVNHAACTSWQLPKVTPQEYVAQHPDKKLRITPMDEHGNPQDNVVLTGVRFSGDSVFGMGPADVAERASGRAHQGPPIGFSLRQVAAIDVRRADGGRTGLLVAVFVGLVAVGLLAAQNADYGPTGCIFGGPYCQAHP